MKQVLSLSFRPKTFSQMVGADKLIKSIRGHISEGRVPTSWMFTGGTGSGKTTVARILALSLQCTHQSEFGNPCLECRKNKAQFDIVEINASEITRVEDVKEGVTGYNCAPRPGSQRRVYILDECQMMSTNAQNYLLKLLEDCPKSTIWILCTTEPDKIKSTLRSRCVPYTMSSFQLEDIQSLAKRAINAVGADRSSEDLAEALMVSGIRSPRLILMAVEKYLADPNCTPEEAAMLELSTEIDIQGLNRAIVKGNWRDAAKWLKSCNPEESRSVANVLMVYLHTILVNEVDTNDRNKIVADAIKELGRINLMGGKTSLAMVTAVAYDLTSKFKYYKR